LQTPLFVNNVFNPEADQIENAEEVLRRVFGFAQFRQLQKEVIAHVLSGNNAVVLMPTGAGKSLCYQIPALVREGVGIVVSPLIALMRDQVDALRQAGVRAGYLNSSLSFDEARSVESDMRAGKLDLIYVAPERLMMDSFLEFLENTRISLFAIDEAHCVSQWGHNFRPEYAQLSILRQRFANVPIIALTATADGPTRKDISERLNLADAKLFTTGFDRPNIHYRVEDRQDAKLQLLSLIRDEFAEESGIVYCQSRNKVDMVAKWLGERGIKALPYHAGMDAGARERHQNRFIREENIVMVATIAFGMGIDKPNVRFVAHLDLPRTLEAYYQETGRAGRDGLASIAWMSYGLSDVIETKFRISSSELDDRQKRIELQKFEALLGFCESVSCRRSVLLKYFGDQPPERCGNCDRCQNPAKSWDGTIAAQKALSAVYRTGGKFGVAYLVDVLTGNKTTRVQQWGHHELKTFGVGADLSKSDWHAIFRQLVASGFLSVDIEGHGGIQLNRHSQAILKGERTVYLRELTKPKLQQKIERVKSPSAELHEEDEALWQSLRERRLSISRDERVPPYVIFHDTTLKAMAASRPTTLEELARIPGVGTRKLERYGRIFLDLVAEHSEKR
jgi:ATP-dependent DNA helicase RecQ